MRSALAVNEAGSLGQNCAAEALNRKLKILPPVSGTKMKELSGVMTAWLAWPVSRRSTEGPMPPSPAVRKEATLPLVQLVASSIQPFLSSARWQPPEPRDGTV